MKSIILGAIALFGAFTSLHAQCDKTLQITSSKTNFLNAKNEVQGSKDDNVVVDITKTTITVTPNGDPQNAITGTIKENSCNWTVPFKEGKTVIKSVLVDPSGDTKDATITIEGKNGKITLLAEAKEKPDQKLQLEVTKFEEKDMQ
jgi:hypothetical protein